MSDNPFRAGRMGGVTLSDVKMVVTLKVQPGRSGMSSLPNGDMATTLKPGNNLTLWSEYRPCQGNDYLLFATDFQNTNCFALSDYRVIPLGHSFDTNWLSGKNLNEQIKFMLQYRLDNLKRELQAGEEEKGRLEGGLNTSTNPASTAPKATP